MNLSLHLFMFYNDAHMDFMKFILEKLTSIQVTGGFLRDDQTIEQAQSRTIFFLRLRSINKMKIKSKMHKNFKRII